jgi:trk system potassium uptake protein TrkA
MSQFAVIGLGRFGTAVCAELYNAGHEVLAIDKDEQRIQEIMQNKQTTHAVQVDATKKSALQPIGITDFDAVVVAMASSIQDSVLITLLLKELGVKNVISKAASSAHGLVLEKIGANKVVFPENEMGKRIAHTLVSGALNVIDLAADFTVYELNTPKKFINKSLLDLKLRQKSHVNVIAIKRADKTISDLDPEEKILDGDIFVIVGKKENIAKIAK